jgi:hypothetical protein
MLPPRSTHGGGGPSGYKLSMINPVNILISVDPHQRMMDTLRSLLWQAAVESAPQVPHPSVALPNDNVTFLGFPARATTLRNEVLKEPLNIKDGYLYRRRGQVCELYCIRRLLFAIPL